MPGKFAEIGDRLREIERSLFDGDRNTFASKLGISYNQISNLINGHARPGGKVLRKLEELGYSNAYIIEGKAIPGTQIVSITGTKYPVVAGIRAGHGVVNEVSAGYQVNMMGEMWGPEDPALKGAIYFKVEGRSMEPRWDEGDYVLVMPGRRPKSGDYAVVGWNSDEHALKKIFFMPDRKVLLQSLNSEYSPIQVDLETIWFFATVLYTKHRSIQ